MKKDNLFLVGRYADFYLVSNLAKETKFRVEPTDAENVRFMENMNGVLSLLEQHLRFQQLNPEKFIPRVAEFNAKTGEMILTVLVNLTSAVPTLLLDSGNYVIDYRDAIWITQQAFQLASLANEAGIVLSFSTDNFLVCYESQSFVLLDWTMAQCSKLGQIDVIVAQEQTVDLANMLLGVVDYDGVASDAGIINSRLAKFIRESAVGAFLSATEAQKVLNSILG